MGGNSRLFRNLSILFVILFLFGSAWFSLYSLRANNLKMQELRSDIYKADKSGQSEKEISKKITKLRNYVATHMNTGIQTETDDAPAIQLAYSYYRDFTANWRQDVVSVAARVPDLYADLPQSFDGIKLNCESESDIVSERMTCIAEAAVGKINGMPDPPEGLDLDRYEYNDFASPSWSWDRAGISIIIFGISVLAIVLRLLF